MRNRTRLHLVADKAILEYKIAVIRGFPVHLQIHMRFTRTLAIDFQAVTRRGD